MASPLKINDKDKPSEETKKAVLMRYISDSADYTSGKAVQDVPKHLMYSSRQFGYVGLENQGATCYLNSLLQMFYNIPCLRKAVNKMPTTDASSIHMALQHVFSELHFSDNIVSTRELTKALGWDVNTQQDVHEFNIRLFAELKNIDPHIGQLFEGHLIQSIHCKNVEYQSTKHCLFYDIQLDVMGCQDVYASFDKYVEVEEMDGVNQYEAGQHGFQAIAVLGTCDIALELGKKVICQRDCQTCNGWNALRSTMCKGTGRVMYQVKNYTLRSGEKATAEAIADAIAENRAEIVHLPATMDLNVPLPSKDCETCDGSGVMKCPECKDKLQVRISADDIIEPPWKAYNIMKKMDYPYEHIIDSMKDPSIAAFWLITMPQIMGGFEYDDEVKQKIWWQYKENMRYDQLRDAVAKKKPGWEYLQEGLISMDPERARNDPVVVKNIPYYKAKSALENEVMKLNPPPRPQNWGELNVPLNASSWSEEDLKDPKKLYEMTVLLNAQREIAEKILDDQWEAKWRQEKLNKMLEEKLQPYIQNVDNGVLPQPILAGPPKNDQKRNRQPKRWWLF